jgi:dTMP kinase
MLKPHKNFQKLPGFFVGFEGIDGSGKTTLIDLVLKQLITNNYPALKTREPGGSAIGQSIRNLLQHSNAEMSSLTEAFLFAADRAEHIKSLIAPAINQGKIVLSDRTYLSSMVYQADEELSQETILKINTVALQGTSPDLVIFIDISPEEALKRAVARAENQTRFESRGVEYFKKVADEYKKLLKAIPNSMILDGTLKSEILAKIVVQKIIQSVEPRNS